MALAVITGCALVEAHGASFMTKLWDFNGTSGHKDPVGALIKGDDGNYYGTSWQGGNNNTGSVYRYSPTTGIFYEFYSFTGGTDGANP